MKRFNFEDNEEFPDERVPDLEELTESEYEQLVEHAEFVDLKNLNLREFDLNQKLVYKAIKLCENNFLWKFRTTKKKLLLVKEAYEYLKALTNIRIEG